MDKKDLIKRALNEYAEDKARHYEELADKEIKFSPGFDEKIKEQIDKPGILRLLSPKAKKFIAMAAVFVVVVAAGSQIIPKIGKDSTDEPIISKEDKIKDEIDKVQDNGKLESKNNEEAEKAESLESKKIEDKMDEKEEEAYESIDSKPEEEKGPGSRGPSEETKEPEDVESSKTEEEKRIHGRGPSDDDDGSQNQTALDDAPMAQSGDYLIALSKPLYYSGEHQLDIYIKNSSPKDAILNNTFTLIEPNGNSDDYSFNQNDEEINIIQNSTRYLQLDLMETAQIKLQSGKYKLITSINDQKLELEFEVR